MYLTSTFNLKANTKKACLALLTLLIPYFVFIRMFPCVFRSSNVTGSRGSSWASSTRFGTSVSDVALGAGESVGELRCELRGDHVGEAKGEFKSLPGAQMRRVEEGEAEGGDVGG